jgi:quercetin dioxygenase-like cupin family protein
MSRGEPQLLQGDVTMSDQTASYFAMDTTTDQPDPSFPPAFTGLDEVPFVPLGPGIRFKPVFGKSLLLNHVYMEPHTVAPMHRHPEEQIGLMLEGEFEFEMNGEKRLIGPGDIYVVPPHVPHTARTLDQPCVVLDVFSPPRSGFREMLERVKGGDVSKQDR